MRNLSDKQIQEMLNNAGIGETGNNQIKKAKFSNLQYEPVEDVEENISILSGIQLELEVELGSAFLNLKDVINLNEGQVIALDRIAGDNVDMIANKKWLACGEVLILNEALGIRISSFNKEDENSDRDVK